MYTCQTRCPACPRINQMINGDGPENPRAIFIGERPGFEENNRHRVFVGNTGREFNNTYLPSAHLTRDGVYVTNAIKCFYEKGDERMAESLVKSCSEHHLQNELNQFNSDVPIVPMGTVACNLFDIKLEAQHGMLQTREVYGEPRFIYPVWHPAAGLHDTSWMLPLINDFRKMSRAFSGLTPSPVDEFPEPDYRDITDPDEVDFLMGRNDQPITVDTETHEEKFWCLSFSLEPGTGYMIRLKSNDGAPLNVFRRRIKERKSPVIFHNFMFDGDVLNAIDIQLPMKYVDDTMVRSYHLGDQPQALKLLAFRLCGMVMQEFNDLVLPWSAGVMTDWFMRVASVEWGQPSEQILWDDVKNAFRLYKPQSLNTKLKRMFTDAAKAEDDFKIIKIYKRWDDWSYDEKLPVIKQFGMLAKPSIIHVPLKKVIYYSCRDSDATIRIWPILKSLCNRFRHANRIKVSRVYE